MRYSDILKFIDKDGLTVVLGSNHNITMKTNNLIQSSHAAYLTSWSIRPKHIPCVDGTDKICCG